MRLLYCSLALAATLCPSQGQTIEKITPKGPRQVAITAAAKGRAVLQWTFEDRNDSIWTSLADSRPARSGRVSFLAPRHKGLTPRFRVIDQQPVTPGAALFDPHRIRTLKLEITNDDIKKMRENLPTFGDNGGVVIGPGDGNENGEVAGPGGGEGDPNIQPGDEVIVDPGDPGDFPGEVDFSEPSYAYVTAIASLDGGPKSRLGIRIKGNASLVSTLIDKRENFPFKVDVNYFKSGQNIDGIQKFNLHPVVSKKPTKRAPGMPSAVFPGEFGLEEFLSYGAFREFGVPASRTGWMDVYLNGKYMGLYTSLENTDAKFLERNFGSARGSTYKPENEYLEWNGNEFSDYPTLNWKGGGDGTHQAVLRMMNVINHKPVSSFPRVLDIQSVFNYTAGNLALGNWDTYEALGHNYLLHEGVPGRFYMLPWDLNLSQSDYPGNSLYGKSEPLDSPENTSSPKRALTDRLYRIPDNDARYRRTLKAFIEGPASSAVLNARIDDAVSLLGTRLEKQAIQQLRENIDIRIAKVKQLMALPKAK